MTAKLTSFGSKRLVHFMLFALTVLNRNTIYIYVYTHTHTHTHIYTYRVQVNQQITERTIMQFANADTQTHFSRGLPQFRFRQVNLNIFHGTNTQIY